LCIRDRRCTVYKTESDPRQRWCANRGSDHKESVLLMASPDPTGDGVTVAVVQKPVRPAEAR